MMIIPTWFPVGPKAFETVGTAGLNRRPLTPRHGQGGLGESGGGSLTTAGVGCWP